MGSESPYVHQIGNSLSTRVRNYQNILPGNIILSIAGRGHMLGEEDVLLKRCHTLSAKVKSRTATCFKIKASDFRQKLARDNRGKDIINS